MWKKESAGSAESKRLTPGALSHPTPKLFSFYDLLLRLRPAIYPCAASAMRGKVATDKPHSLPNSEKLSEVIS